MMCLCRKTGLPVIAAALVLLLSGCGMIAGIFNKLPEGVMPMEEIIEQGKSPVEVISAGAVMGVGNMAVGANPTVTVTLKNVSDRPLKIIGWAVVNINKDGKLCALATEETGYSDIYGIEPGEEISLEAFSSDPETSRVEIVIKDVTYVADMNGYEINMKWENGSYNADIEAVLARYAG